MGENSTGMADVKILCLIRNDMWLSSRIYCGIRVNLFPDPAMRRGDRCGARGDRWGAPGGNAGMMTVAGVAHG